LKSDVQPPISDILCQILAGQSDHVDWSAFAFPDWERIVAMSEDHGIAPLLTHVFDETVWPDQMPAHARRALRSCYYATAAHNLLLYRELTRILDGIQSTHPVIPLVVLKGAALARTLYPDMALRPLSDIDLLVPRQHVEAAARVLHSLGYDDAHLEIPEMRRGLSRLTTPHLQLRGGPNRSVMVELHWALVAGDTDWRSPDLEWFWQQTQPWEMERGSPFSNGRSPSPILQLTPAAHLLYLAAHLMLQHGLAHARLVWYYDLHLLIARCGNQLDWNEILAQASELQWSAALEAALRGVQKRFHSPVPEDVLNVLASVSDYQAASLMRRKASVEPTTVAGIWTSLTSLDWQTRLQVVCTNICPSPEYMCWRYRPKPAWLWPLYYPYRWFDILRDGLSTIWRIGRRKREDRKWKIEDGKGEMESERRNMENGSRR